MTELTFSCPSSVHMILQVTFWCSAYSIHQWSIFNDEVWPVVIAFPPLFPPWRHLQYQHLNRFRFVGFAFSAFFRFSWLPGFLTSLLRASPFPRRPLRHPPLLRVPPCIGIAVMSRKWRLTVIWTTASLPRVPILYMHWTKKGHAFALPITQPKIRPRFLP